MKLAEDFSEGVMINGVRRIDFGPRVRDRVYEGREVFWYSRVGIKYVVNASTCCHDYLMCVYLAWNRVFPLFLSRM